VDEGCGPERRWVLVAVWSNSTTPALGVTSLFRREFYVTQSERRVDPSVEERSLSLFKSERMEDLAAIGLAALLVLAVLLGIRV